MYYPIRIVLCSIYICQCFVEMHKVTMEETRVTLAMRRYCKQFLLQMRPGVAQREPRACKQEPQTIDNRVRQTQPKLGNAPRPFVIFLEMFDLFFCVYIVCQCFVKIDNVAMGETRVTLAMSNFCCKCDLGLLRGSPGPGNRSHKQLITEPGRLSRSQATTGVFYHVLSDSYCVVFDIYLSMLCRNA